MFLLISCVRLLSGKVMKPQATSAVIAAALLSAVALSARAEPTRSTSLQADEIRSVLVGKRISYSPPGWVHVGIFEEFHHDGKWGGQLWGRAPVSFSGQWSIDGDQICVTADKGTVAEFWHSGPFCRTVWKDDENGALRAEYLGDQPSSRINFGLQTLTVSDLAAR